MKRKHVSILRYYTPSSVGSTQPEPEIQPEPEPEPAGPSPDAGGDVNCTPPDAGVISPSGADVAVIITPPHAAMIRTSPGAAAVLTTPGSKNKMA